jgi:hypothetical protein
MKLYGCNQCGLIFMGHNPMEMGKHIAEIHFRFAKNVTAGLPRIEDVIAWYFTEFEVATGENRPPTPIQTLIADNDKLRALLREWIGLNLDLGLKCRYDNLFIRTRAALGEKGE